MNLSLPYSIDSSFHSLAGGLYFLVETPTIVPLLVSVIFFLGSSSIVPCPFPLFLVVILFHCSLADSHYSLVEDFFHCSLPISIIPVLRLSSVVPLSISIIPCCDPLPLFLAHFHYSLL